MTMSNSYRSEAFAAIHETIEALHEIGAIDQRTLRGFDEACLTPARVLTADEIRQIRARERVSQPVLARYLNVSRNLVSDWERRQETRRPGLAAPDGGAEKKASRRSPEGRRGRDRREHPQPELRGSLCALLPSSAVFLRPPSPHSPAP